MKWHRKFISLVVRPNSAITKSGCKLSSLIIWSQWGVLGKWRKSYRAATPRKYDQKPEGTITDDRRLVEVRWQKRGSYSNKEGCGTSVAFGLGQYVRKMRQKEKRGKTVDSWLTTESNCSSWWRGCRSGSPFHWWGAAELKEAHTHITTWLEKFELNVQCGSLSHLFFPVVFPRELWSILEPPKVPWNPRPPPETRADRKRM